MKNIIQILSVFCMIFVFVTTLSAQRRTEQSTKPQFEGAKSAFFVELLGNGLLFSVNYDTRVANNFGLRGGIGYFGDVDGGGGILTIPVTGNFLLGKDGRYFEVGAGATYISGSGDFFDIESSIVGTMSFMYRRQPVDGGFMWKIGLTPFIASGIFIPYWVGIGIGYAW